MLKIFREKVELPRTGGAGTMAMTAGGIMAVAAGCFAVAKVSKHKA